MSKLPRQPMEFLVLGPLEVRDDDGTSIPIAAGKQRALLADLLLHGNRAVAVERLVDDLWGEDVPETAVKALQVYVSKLRKLLPSGRLQTRAPGYVLELSDGELDLRRFERLVVDGRAALAQGRAEEASRGLTEALALWRGSALAEFDEPFARAEGARLEEVRTGCLEERIEADLALARHASLVGELEAAVARHPLRERLRSQLLVALYRSGRQAEALAAYQAFRRTLDDELGIEPSQRLRELERRMLQQDPALELRAATRVEVARAPAAVAVAAPSGAFVGRDPELAQLHRLLGEALGGRRRVVFVTGEAGVGKTTLVERFLAEIGADAEQPLVVGRGQCIEHRGPGEPYLPVLDALGRIGRDPGGAHLVELLETSAPTWLVQLPSLVSQADLSRLDSVIGATRERMLREMVEALDAAAAIAPLVLVLEDLHWSDLSTLDLVDAIAHRQTSARLLLLATLRSDEPGSGAEPVRKLATGLRLRNLSFEVALDSLSESAARDYLAFRLPGHELPPELAGLLRSRTRGNPLFMEKLLDAWLEQGVVAQHDGGWDLAVGLDELARSVPETVRGLIEQRFRSLDERDRQVLEAASLVGIEFASALVAAALELDEDEVDERLEALGREGLFVVRTGEESWADGCVSSRYAFAHDLCQEVLPGRIAAARRARLHGRILRRLEAAHGDGTADVATELAWHAVNARDPERAVHHLRAAAVQALQRSAFREALGHLHAALDALRAMPEGPGRARLELELQTTLGPPVIAVSGWSSDEAEAAYVRARELAEELGDDELMGLVLLRLATLHEFRGEYARSEALLDESFALPAESQSAERLVYSHELMACTLYHKGAHREAIEHAERALALYDGVYTDPVSAGLGETPAVLCHVWTALALWQLGRPDAAVERAQRAVAASTLGTARHGRALAQAQAAIVSLCRREHESARAWAAAAIETAQPLGYAYWAATAAVARGWALAAAGDADAGIAEARRGLELARSTGARMDDPFFLGVIADAQLLGGRAEDALEAVSEGLAAIAEDRAFFYEPELLRLRGAALEQLDDGAGAEESFDAALRAARRLGSRMLELRAATSLARRWADTGRTRDAIRLLGDLEASFVEGRDTPDVQEAGALLRALGAEPVEQASSTGSFADAAPTAPPPRPVQYARSGGVAVAYQVVGDGPLDLVLVNGWVCTFQPSWEHPLIARFYRGLSSIGRLILFDKRGTGLSDRLSDDRLPDLETRMDDVRAVMDAVGSESAVIVGISEGGAMSTLFAATYPERTHALVLIGTFARLLHAPDYPAGISEREFFRRIAMTDEDDWAEAVTKEWLARVAPKLLRDEEAVRWYTSYVIRGASPGANRAIRRMNEQIDIRHVLPTLTVPTLVMCRSDEYFGEATRYMADHIPGARFTDFPGDDHLPWEGDQDALLDELDRFLEEHPRRADTDRVLATLLFTDIVGSTAKAVELGDRAWHDLLGRHHQIVRAQLALHRGREIDTAGDGVFATFDGPARAVRCASAIVEAVRGLGLEVRAGVHTGEIEQAAGAPRGVAVHIGARIAAEAQPGEVLVSSTVKDIVAGSGLAFADRGKHVLKGIDEPRRLFAVGP